MFKNNLKWYDYILMVVVVAFIVLQVHFEMELIDLMAELTGKVRLGLPVSQIWQTGKTMLLTAGLIMASIIVSSSIASMISTKFAANLRANIFKKVNSFSQEEINKFLTASLITRSTNDVTQVQSTMLIT